MYQMDSPLWVYLVYTENIDMSASLLADCVHKLWCRFLKYISGSTHIGSIGSMEPFILQREFSSLSLEV